MSKELDMSAVENCVCFNLRWVTRAVTQFYDAEMRRHGIRPTQGSILVSLRSKDSWNMAELSDWLGMERTTLVRNLQPLQRDGLVQAVGGGRGNRVELTITTKGRKQVEKLTPAWKSAQSAVVKTLGETRWSAILSDHPPLRARHAEATTREDSAGRESSRLSGRGELRRLFSRQGIRLAFRRGPSSRTRARWRHCYGALPRHVGHRICHRSATEYHAGIEAIDDAACPCGARRNPRVKGEAYQRRARLGQQALGDFCLGNATLAAPGHFLSRHERMNRKPEKET